MQRIYAHRGASAYAPENTLEAFDLAVRQGAHGVELDVHLTKDGEVVVLHDETIDRTSDGCGAVAAMTLADAKRFHFHNQMPGFEQAAIPTLREAFALLKPTALHVNVELKTDRYAYEGMPEKCLALAAEMGMADRVLYSSFNHQTLLQVKALDASAPCGILYGRYMERPIRYAVDHGLQALHPHFKHLLVPGFVRSAHKKKLLVNPWTVDEEADIRRVLRGGADIVITNVPDRALAVLRELDQACRTQA